MFSIVLSFWMLKPDSFKSSKDEGQQLFSQFPALVKSRHCPFYAIGNDAAHRIGRAFDHFPYSRLLSLREWCKHERFCVSDRMLGRNAQSQPHEFISAQ